MPEEVKRKRGRPRKNPVVETNSQSSPAVDTNTSNVENNEFCSFANKDEFCESIFNCGVYDYFSKEDIDRVLRNPIENHETAIRLSEFVYGKNGIVTNSIDYPIAMMTLDRLITCKSNTKKAEINKALMDSTLKRIKDKKFMRDALLTDSTDGICFYYFETTEKQPDKTKYLSDYEVENIVEINELGINASIITLPWKYTKIIGKKNGRYVLAFNLQYFNDYTGEKLEKKLRKYPKEISDGYKDKNRKGDWITLNNNNTICHKIKCKDTEPWGRSLIISALEDVLYKDYFTDTKRNVLDNINNQVLYEVFPENKQGNGSSLNKNQQENQHNTVKQAIMNKNNRGGISFMSLAAGTKLDSIDVKTDIFDDKNESNLGNNIATDMGVSASLLGAISTGTFAGGVNNLELITAQMYSWICEIKDELVYVINKNIIKDEKNPVDIYYFPTSFVNRKQFFDMMQTLYTSASGSLKFLIASSGVDPDIYLSVMDEEREKKFDELYKPHQTSFTYNGDNSDDKGGRPETDDPSENTIKSKENNGNSLPSPSDKQ